MIEQPSSSTKTLNNKIEILSINDKDPNDAEGVQITPNERMVVSEVIQIWKHDPATESLGIAKLHVLVKAAQPNWSLSEKRLKTLLKKYGLLANQPKFCYVNEITSKPTPGLELPPKIKLQTAKSKGKGLYASQFIAKGELIWEEKPFIFVPPLDHVYLMKIGKSCAYCGKLLQSRLFDSQSFLNGLDCKYCSQLWCSKGCKKSDSLHIILNHNEKLSKSKNKLKLDSSKWQKYKEFCLENRWSAAFAVGLIRIHELSDETGIVAKQFDAFAKIGQDIRYKASDSSAGAFDNSNGGDGALFVKEQQELLWHKGHELFNEIFDVEGENPDTISQHKISYEDYLLYIGTYNINNIESLYLIQSHLNHNCVKNVDVRVADNTRKLSDGIKVYAARNIKAGEELVTSYVNPTHNVNQRKRELRVNWGFNCSCNRCKEEEKETHRLQSNIGSDPKKASPNPNEKKADELTVNGDKPLKSSRKNSMRKSSDLSSRNDIKKMLEGAKNDGEFELEEADDSLTVRRKSVRFDEKVVAVANE
ncbi:S-adenosylmethionine-dependent methyltransferase [Saccharomycopsis crataegensis]|uniref:Histone-lysine N-methyltransferase SET5 n=1 Tax=Saccharomycopsis crataegensis TaxID=43959 RepID=A0AAV5QSM3_9ASCO|nr:S-adenosylmethionine-dependent methyltransferase [Saccharomycopsis crataegensis]